MIIFFVLKKTFFLQVVAIGEDSVYKSSKLSVVK